MSDFFDYCFFQGSNPVAGRNTLYGWIHLRTAHANNRGNNFPLATRALKGWAKKCPGGSRDPLPFAVLCLLGKWWIANGFEMVAAAALLAFDLYTRPQETLSLRHGDVYPPQGFGGRSFRGRWTVVVAPLESGRTTKTGDTDNSIEAGGRVRGFVRELLHALRDGSRKQQHIFGFTLPFFEAAFRKGIAALGLEALRITPHCLRHGGPSHDAWLGVRSLDEIQKRGQWSCKKSVRRYEKHGRLLRQLSLVPAHLRPQLQSAEKNFPAVLIAAVQNST